MLIEDSLAEPGECGEGLRSVCIREVQKDLAQSSKLLLETKLGHFGLSEADGFKVFRDVISTPGDGLITFKGMNDYTADSIKSLEGFKRAWWEEAQGATQHSIALLRPTMRATGSQMWWSYNPRRKTDPVNAMFRGAQIPTGAIVVRANWRDNPWFTAELEQERQDCLRMQPDQYDHIWEGGYITIAEGAYFAAALTAAKAEGRIGKVAADPLMTIRLFADIGGTGARADAFAMWAVQFIGKEIRVLDYYEAVGQPLASHLNWMRGKGYTPPRAQIWLPHDGATNDKVYSVSYESALRDAGYTVTVVPNQGKGAAAARIEALRRLFPNIWFNADTTEPGRDALGWYHERKDEARGIGLGPEHDWASHGCFTADTLVRTEWGLVRFDKLPQTGLVSTPCGWMPFRNPRLTIANAPLVEVQFSDGHTVKCTPDHLFATGGGWKSAECLETGSLILSTSTRSRSILTAACIGLGLTRNTLAGAASAFIAMCGRMLSDQFRNAATFIIGTETRLTTGSTTLSPWTAGSTLASHGMKAPRPIRPSIFQPWRGIVPEIGIAQKKGCSGISGTLNGHSSGPKTPAQRNHASSAAKYLWGWIGRLLQHKNTAPPRANVKPIASPAKPTLMPLRIEIVRHLSQRADVWDITVPGIECFALANGAVVHNSDAFGLMAVAYEEPRKANKIKYSFRGVV